MSSITLARLSVPVPFAEARGEAEHVTSVDVETAVDEGVACLLMRDARGVPTTEYDLDLAQLDALIASLTASRAALARR